MGDRTYRCPFCVAKHIPYILTWHAGTDVFASGIGSSTASAFFIAPTNRKGPIESGNFER